MPGTERQVYIPSDRDGAIYSAMSVLSLLDEKPRKEKVKLSIWKQIKYFWSYYIRGVTTHKTN